MFLCRAYDPAAFNIEDAHTDIAATFSNGAEFVADGSLPPPHLRGDAEPGQVKEADGKIADEPCFEVMTKKQLVAYCKENYIPKYSK